MTSGAEASASRNLRVALASLPTGEHISESPELQQALSGLGCLVPRWLAEIYAEWEGEALDGFGAHVARKTGDREVDFLGYCWLFSDQTIAPIHIRLQLSRMTDAFAWLELKLGEKRHDRGMERIRPSYSSSPSFNKRLHRLRQEASSMTWAYQVTFGERQQ